MKTRAVVTEIIIALISAVFLFTAVLKWGNMPKFVGQMQGMPLPIWASTGLAYALPTSMGLLALWMLFGIKRRIPLILSSVLFLSMTVFIRLIVTYTISDVYPCSCAGLFDLSWNIHFIINIFLTVVSTVGVLTINNKNDNDPLIPVGKFIRRKILRRKSVPTPV